MLAACVCRFSTVSLPQITQVNSVTMAWAPSIGDILALYDLAQKIYVGCRNAPDEFTAVQINVCSVMCSVNAISRASKDQRSILNRDESTRRDVRTQSGMCYQLLVQIKEVQKKYPNRNMSLSQRTAWHFSDRSKLYDKVGQLDKLVQNFSTFLNIVSAQLTDSRAGLI